MTRSRIDALLVDRGLFLSLEQARAAVLAGEVRVGDTPVRTAGELVDESADIDVAARRRFVSRGGEKLAGALAVFGVPVAGRRAVDVGASTGGFTDCLLQSGASTVAAIDVGYGQLAWSLRTDERVTVFERTNIRHADPAELGSPFDVVVVDVSFISLRTVLPQLLNLIAEDGDLVALVKPQFEAGKANVGKRGVVDDPEVHTHVLQDVVAAVAENGLVTRGIAFSPIKGPEGNIEFWLWAARHGALFEAGPESVVAAAHAALGG